MWEKKIARAFAQEEVLAIGATTVPKKDTAAEKMVRVVIKTVQCLHSMLSQIPLHIIRVSTAEKVSISMNQNLVESTTRILIGFRFTKNR